MKHRKNTILVAEDDEELSHLLKLRFEAMGYEVVQVFNGGRVVDLIRDRLPDLIILDVFLPDVDGLTLLKQIKAPFDDIETGAPSKIKDIPVVIVTGKAPMVENMTRVEGAVDFFIKPVDALKMVNRVNELLELKR